MRYEFSQEDCETVELALHYFRWYIPLSKLNPSMFATATVLEDKLRRCDAAYLEMPE